MKAKVMVVDDEVGIREMLKASLGMKGFEVTTVPSAKQALARIFAEPYDLVILDISIGDESGMDVLRKIRESNKKIPVVIYSGSVTSDLEREARSIGANEVLRKDTGVGQLTAQIEKILKACRPEKTAVEQKRAQADKCIMIVDDESGIRDVLKTYFKSKGYRVIEASSGEEALKIAETEKFPVALLDVNMTGIDGIETLGRLLKMRPGLGVVMVTSEQEDGKVKTALEMGAYGYVLKPFDFLYLDLVVMSKLNIAAA